MSSDRRKTIVLFDVGGVLLQLDYGSFYKEAARLSLKLTTEEFKQKYIDSNLEALSLLGEISDDEYLEKLGKLILPNEAIPKKELLRIIRLCWKSQNDKVVEIKSKIYSAGYTIGIFSNTSNLAYKIIAEKHPQIYELYDKSFLKIFSFDLHSMKPEPLMYEQIKGYDKVVLIDDKESYLNTGIKEFGWQGILFTGMVDANEAIRAKKGHNEKAHISNNLKIANSNEEIVIALREMGIEI